MKSCPYPRWRYLLAAIAIGSFFPIIAPALADGTTAGTAIRNTATGTFSDGTTTYNTTSNEVTIVVSEVAGITVTAQPPSVASPNAGDTLFVDYVITNTGNDPTQFVIPGVATLSNTTAFSQNGQLQIVAVDGTTLGAPVNVPAGGDTTGNLLPNGSIAANPGTGTIGTITVRVPIQVLPSATSGQTLTVSLGNTNPVNGQNTDRAGNDNPNDIYTQDNADGTTGETNGAPINGVREAMATSTTITVGARLQAFAAVLKAVGSYTNNSTPSVLTDDVLTYRLSLRVENPTTPPAGLVVSDLYGTQLDVDNSTATAYVLVSDAIPDGLQLSSTAPTPAPGGWVTVYTQDALATTTALNAKWVTTRPTTGGAITRVGFIYNTTVTPLSKGAVGVGTTISGFAFDLTPTGTFTGGQVANIAQVFGQSQPGTVTPGTATQIVYDESGDQTTNNGLEGTNPDPTSGGVPAANGGISDGVADPGADGTDPGTGTDPSNTGNTNQGTDGGGNGTKPAGGEVTLYTIAATPLNGPNGQPGAVGPTDTNDDYTNKSIVVPAGLSPSTPLTDAQTTPVTFENTAQNTSASPQAIALLPTPPTTATDLPDQTRVTITDPATGNTATYTYTSAGGFVFDTGTGTSATDPVELTVAAGGTANYTVIVDLPGAEQLRGFPVPITAFVDTNNDGSPANEPSNITIDRVYTNYVSLVKEARMLEANGTPVAGGAGTFTTDQTALSAAAIPGRIIEYRITYTNISTSGGTNSVTLPANNLVITENGTAGTNTWFASTLDPVFAVSGGNGSAVDPGGTITVTSSGAPADIQIYVDTVTSVAPGSAGGTFTFQRQIR